MTNILGLDGKPVPSVRLNATTLAALVGRMDPADATMILEQALCLVVKQQILKTLDFKPDSEFDAEKVGAQVRKVILSTMADLQTNGVIESFDPVHHKARICFREVDAPLVLFDDKWSMAVVSARVAMENSDDQ